MGQYFEIVNVTKMERLVTYDFGDSAKWMEFASGGPAGILQGLALLLHKSDGHGGGDFAGHGMRGNPLVEKYLGRWVGDNIAIVGDYDSSELFGREDFTNISDKVVELMKLDPWFAGQKPPLGRRF